MDLARLNASQLVQMIVDGETTASELVEACIARIDDREGDVGAWIHLDRDHARKQAADRDSQRASGLPCGPLHGIPVGVKDIFDTEDYPTENGTALLAGRRPNADATSVRLLREAGAVILGKTVTTELAVGASGKTRNPHNLDHTPGGSSSGSAAAVADWMVPLALGTQTAGSVIRPAAYCGVVGFKPTYGSVSRQGVLADSPFFDTIGAFARNIEDVALIGDVLMRYDPADVVMRVTSAPNLRNVANAEPPVPPRFAFVKTAAWPKADTTTQEAFGELTEFLGNQCVEIALGESYNDCWDYHRTIVDVDLAKNFATLYAAGPGGLSDPLRDRVERGRQITAIDYNNACEWREAFNNGLDDIFTEFDAIITPAAAGEAPVGLESTGDRVFNTLWTFCGTPAVSVPLLEGPNGLPLGVQLVGPRGDDARLLRNARWLATEVAKAD